MREPAAERQLENVRAEQLDRDVNGRPGQELADDLELGGGVVAPTAGWGDRGDGAGPAAALQLERHPPAQRVADDVGGAPAEGVELALDGVGKRGGVEE